VTTRISSRVKPDCGRRCIKLTLMKPFLISAFGTALYSRNPRRGLTSLASPREVSKRRRPPPAALRASLGRSRAKRSNCLSHSTSSAMGDRGFKAPDQGAQRYPTLHPRIVDKAFGSPELPQRLLAILRSEKCKSKACRGEKPEFTPVNEDFSPQA
jgi:hypothetical protein